jgi:ABC-2 type transport system permease protein
MIGKNLNKKINILLVLTIKELKVRYKRASFGFIWILINPAIQMVTIGFVFSFFINIQNYFLFLLSGLLPWSFFSVSISKAIPSIVYQKNLLKKAEVFPASIPISIILSTFIHSIAAFLLLAIYLVVTNDILFPIFLLFIPAYLWLLVFAVALSLLAASLHVRYRDIGVFFQTILTPWFYFTPILYNLSMLPVKYRNLFNLNPLTTIFELFHMSIVGVGTISLNILIVNVLSTLLLTIVGLYIYKKNSGYLVDWL